ncbi:MAG: polymer-forming cytoskeletal protein [Desulfobacterales bacterium]|nr:polymer-forming cytoskeletal protein [Desulfobacteraceae bacterium]MBT4363108.1 polymer-forming cytoskeletal protein [Desulfobacteraceae bacterium]MBT7085045.1 polymer-forming cytoskeletal protein [Desulfobacterales bacterium]MBT7696774.1 polymer-forming cytoskeletal protein [Desulfobacterales bacterium]
MKRDKKNLSIIDKELLVDGTISSKGTLVIKGTVTGTLVGDTVVIAEEGSLIAQAKVSSITIGGRFEGDVTASNELIILSTGNCSGTVACKDLTVESGGRLNAKVSYVQSGSKLPNKTNTAPFNEASEKWIKP